eukprot:TRINITY_DN2484_c0_g3_i1.p1 TRINITY_DN2484_c0_g3~~TRINITY_DN2484_c0_g3_i1.p1  ORF type:complete len:221 (-),score=59.88 TRINITY_DN2484_c0_g3_i1:205-867(-)
MSATVAIVARRCERRGMGKCWIGCGQRKSDEQERWFSWWWKERIKVRTKIVEREKGKGKVTVVLFSVAYSAPAVPAFLARLGVVQKEPGDETDEMSAKRITQEHMQQNQEDESDYHDYENALIVGGEEHLTELKQEAHVEKRKREEMEGRGRGNVGTMIKRDEEQVVDPEPLGKVQYVPPVKKRKEEEEEGTNKKKKKKKKKKEKKGLSFNLDDEEDEEL